MSNNPISCKGFRARWHPLIERSYSYQGILVVSMTTRVLGAPLKEAQDALARALDHLVDVLLTRPRRRVEHLAFPVDVRRIDAILC